jgi:hypothetical protein
VRYKRFILLLGMFLGSLGPIAAQTPVPRFVLTQERVAPILTTLQKISIPLPAASFLLSRDLAKSNAHFSFLYAGAYERDHSLDHLSPMDEVKTLILTQASLPLLRFWGGRLQLDAFQSTLHIQSVQLGLVGVGRMRGSLVPGQSYPGGPRSFHLSGISLSIHFGRDERTGHPAHLWRRLTRTIDAALN